MFALPIAAILYFLLSKAFAHSNLRNTPAPFILGNLQFESQAQFIHSVGRCQAEEPTAEEHANRTAILNLVPHHQVSTLGKTTVKVFFHILTSTSGEGAVTDEQVTNQISVLNQAYENSAFEFSLSKTKRYTNDSWYNLHGGTYEQEMKAALRKGRYSALNVYTTVQQGGLLGWSNFPSTSGTSYSYDGIVIDYRTLPGGSYTSYNLGNTLVHESGHWFGLYHTFTGGCVVNENGGDYIPDTPAEAQANYGCPADTTNSCPGTSGGLAGNDPIHNYMDYTDDACMTGFTDDQMAVMKKNWVAFRQNT